MTNKKIYFLISHSSFLIIFLLNLISCGQQQKISKSEFVLGTFCTVTLFENGNEKVINDVFTRLREIDNRFSVNLPASDISRINAAAGIEAVQVHEEVYKLINLSVFDYSEITYGAFNPGIGPIVNLWNISGNPRLPSQQEIDDALGLVNTGLINFNHSIVFDPASRSVFLKHRGMSLDLGAIAKGYAADEAAKIIVNAGIKRAIIDLGGNIVVIGRNEKNRPWRVGIQDPNGNSGEYIGYLNIKAEDSPVSIVTSGVYQRFFEADGIRYHHIFSPETGYPADNELLSVTIISKNSAEADAFSTAVFVLGYEDGINFVNQMPDTEAVFVFKDGSVKWTSNLDFIQTR